ncbi:MAG: ferric iron uptake transcriptional regulator [Burkholderiaceae bacterium]|nr:ferric iron uptake transcriptional regulator [Burkholderiaceae bacterium]
MPHSPDERTTHLHRVGLKATLPRLKVLEILRQSPRRHLSAEDVHRALLQTHADVGLATVYRVLGQLEQAGILARRQFDTGAAVYELDEGGHHDHLVCVACGRVDEFHDPAIEARQAELAAERGFALTEHRLALYGRCRACRDRG